MNPKGAYQVVWTSEQHVGSTVALSPRKWTIDDNNVHEASKSQLFLLEFWNKFWDRRKKDGRKIINIIGGDTVDGDHHATHQIWTQDELIQVEAAVDLLKRGVDMSHKSYLLRGTSAHVGLSGRFDSKVASELGITSHFQLDLTVSGVLFDLAHHGPNVGQRVWNLGNQVRSYGRSVVANRLARGKTPPDVIIRGHVHRQRWETIRDFERTTEVLISPAWQLKTEFVNMISTEDDISDIGGIVIGVENGRVTDVKFDSISFEQTDRRIVR